ncbi:Epsin-3, clathrin recruitment and traffic between the Golgi and endosome [Actinomortierella ambigua]|uniref:Epsin-3, clathrin recruitment and traffic between the Golgi and endosome n=1 Tax=Actinomortierella ambigua TaxID=1343610 RepID=A0A9P6PNB0_9FUNG|nr:Epsin-3, clathrin recruitment and traffic between the Golgi and endosome [Actinomortierella ambigua]
MDNFIENVSGYSMWDIRNAIEKVTAKVMNYTEMEQKVREATSNDPWGASGTLKQELAQATHNFQYFNEIMPTLFKRFHEREPREWRSMYKALVLLEYLVTNGSERVVDEARGHISTIKVLRNFQFVDENGKDEGINVRNRAKEFAEMLSSVDRIKEERKKAKANRNKFVGSGGGSGGGGGGGFAGTGNKYGGFGSDSYFEGGYNGSSDYGSSSRYDGHRSSRGRYDDDESPPAASPPTTRRSTRKTETPRSTPKPEPAKEVNLFDFDEPAPSTSTASRAGKGVQQAADDEWGSMQSAADDFGDFQSAAPATSSSSSNRISVPALPSFNAPMASVLPAVQQRNTASMNNNAGGAFDLLGSSPAKGSNDFFGSSAQAFKAPQQQQQPAITPSLTGQSVSSQSSIPKTLPVTPNPSQSANQNDIWASASGLISLDGLGKAPTKTNTAPSMNALAANSWNSGAWAAPKPGTPGVGSQNNTMAFNTFASTPGTTSTGAGQAKKNNFDDLLF